MPDEDPRFHSDLPQRSAELAFIMEQLARLPTRRELIRFGVWVALGLRVLALVGLDMWLRWVWACNPV